MYVNRKLHQIIQFFKMIFVTLFLQMFASLPVLLLTSWQLLEIEFLKCLRINAQNFFPTFFALNNKRNLNKAVWKVESCIYTLKNIKATFLMF